MSSAKDPYFEFESINARPLHVPPQSRTEHNKFSKSNVTMGTSKPPTVTLQAVSTRMSPVLEAQRNVSHQLDEEHQARHKRRIRILRCIQHLLTALVSLGVAILQGRTYIIYQQTKDVPGAWPSFPDLFPTLLLFATAVAATTMDLSALIAYMFPQTRVGNWAFKLASETRYAITTFKAISYTYSAVGSRVSFNQGQATGQNNDLWSWSCSAKADAMGNVNQASSNCLTSTISWYLSIANVGVEVLGVLIDAFVKIDDVRYKKKARAAHGASDMKPLLMSSSYQGAPNSTKHKYSRLTDEQLDKLDKYEGDADKYVKKQSSKMDKMDDFQMDDLNQPSTQY